MRLGSDPEVFLLTNHKPKAVCGLIGADKWNPLQVEGMPQGYTCQEDNVALEFGVPPVATCAEFVEHIQAVQKAFLKRYKGFTFSKLSCMVFPPSEMKHPMSRVFGCEPDFNAWTGEENKKPKPPIKNMRSAGGHIHVETTLEKNHVVQAMDLFLTVPSLFMDKGEDRRKLYGKAGACRYKPYGVEHRVLSSFWIFKKPYIEWVWRNTERALEFVDKGYGFNAIEAQFIQDTINTSNKAYAQLLVDSFGLEAIVTGKQIGRAHV